MPQFDENEEREQILSLIDEGLLRLRQIETDIKMLMAQSQEKNPIAKAIAAALEQIDPDVQFETIRHSRAKIRWVRSKIEVDEYSDDDAAEICDALDAVKDMGKRLRDASKAYTMFLQARAEVN